MDFKTFIKNAAHVVPDDNQYRLLTETPFYAFVHFGVNTFTGREWGDGTEDPAIFDPEELDCEQWCRAFKAASMGGVVITAKHHDGFCLWQTEQTMHSMKSSPYKNGKGDVVKELKAACDKYGLKFGFYLSPWDRNSQYYGTDEYNDFYKKQLTELLTNYGEVFHVWFDGACGEGPNGKKQTYDFEGYLDLIAKYQPNATFFNDHGIIRWCGNEAGETRVSEWSVVPKELCYLNKNVQTNGALINGDLSYMYNGDMEIGSLNNIMYSEGLVFSPSEVDMSIRPGWFYHPEEEPHSLERLFDTYLNSVGGNTTFILNVPPMPNGKLDPRDIKRLEELGQKIKTELSEDKASGAKTTCDTISETQCRITLELSEKQTVKYIELQEDILYGQRVEAYKVTVCEDGNAREFFGTTIGNKKIIKLKRPYCTDKVTLQILSSRDAAIIKAFKLY